MDQGSCFSKTGPHHPISNGNYFSAVIEDSSEKGLLSANIRLWWAEWTEFTECQVNTAE